MTEFWLVRHGQTLWNQEGRAQGSLDIELDETGLSQAQQLAWQLKDSVFQAIFSSPLKRAYKTAEIIASQIKVAVQVDARLVEISLGVWEGMLFPDIQAQYPHELEQRKSDPVHALAPGGETALAVSLRMRQAVDDISHRYPFGQVVLVSHGLALSTLFCVATGTPLDEVYDHVPDNAEPVLINWPNGNGVNKAANLSGQG